LHFVPREFLLNAVANLIEMSHELRPWLSIQLKTWFDGSLVTPNLPLFLPRLISLLASSIWDVDRPIIWCL